MRWFISWCFRLVCISVLVTFWPDDALKLDAKLSSCGEPLFMATHPLLIYCINDERPNPVTLPSPLPNSVVEWNNNNVINKGNCVLFLFHYLNTSCLLLWFESSAMISYLNKIIRNECWLNIYTLFGLELVSSSIIISSHNNTNPSLFTGLHNLCCLQSVNGVSLLQALPIHWNQQSSFHPHCRSNHFSPKNAK